MTLLEGAGITDAMAQRAILINSARDWNGLNTGLSGWTAPQTGWRPEVGWGALDLNAALAQRGNYRLGAVEEGEAAFYRATVPAGSKATLAFQMRGFFVGYPGPPFPVQQFKFTTSNLDLHQYDSTGAEVAPAPAFDSPDTEIDAGPDALDPNDTVEQVRSPAAPGSQVVTYKVQSASTIDGASEEPFAITSAAPLTPLASPTVRPVNVGTSLQEVRCDQPFTVSAIARNDSPDLEAGAAELTIGVPTGVELVSGSQSQAVSGGTLETSADSESHSWTLRAIVGWAEDDLDCGFRLRIRHGVRRLGDDRGGRRLHAARHHDRFRTRCADARSLAVVRVQRAGRQPTTSNARSTDRRSLPARVRSAPKA